MVGYNISSMNKLLIIGGSIFFFFSALVYVNVMMFSQDSKESEDFEEQDRVTATMNDPMADSDGDGLRNYEERMYNTSAKHVDSDGDGIWDGEEVRLGTDPTLYGTTSRSVEVRHEDTQSYEFVQTSNPQSLDDVLQDLRQETYRVQDEQAQSPQEEEGDTRQQELVHECTNRLASVLQNTLVTSAQDSATLSVYFKGGNTNTYPIQRMKEAARYAIDTLPGLFNPGECPMLSGSLEDFVSVYQEQEGILDSVLTQNASSTEAVDSWVEYGNNISAWMDIVVRIREQSARLGVVYTPEEPGFMFSGEVAN